MHHDASLGDRFERVAAGHSDRLAIGGDGSRLTFGQLDAAAESIARIIRGRPGALGDRVVVLMGHGAGQIAAALAVFKADRVLVVLNASDPPARLRAAIDDADPCLILAAPDALDLARQCAGPGRAVACAADGGATAAPAMQRRAAGPDDLAVLSYTSGSTGRPRAVMQTHGRLLDSTRRIRESMSLAPEDRVPLFSALSGGNGLGVALSTIFAGASLWPFATMEVGVSGLDAWVDANAISVFSASASLFRSFVRANAPDRRLRSVRLVRLSSEAATWRDFTDFRRLFPCAATFVHTLSSSETGNIAVHRIPRDAIVEEGRLPIGRPADGVAVALLDEEGRPVPHGAAGEIVVRGRGFATGYWRNDALTAARFATVPGEDGLRVVHTGDLGRLRPDGLLEFVGRKDARLKIRGHRIEPAEVEAAVLGLPGIAAAVVCARERPGLEPQLVAFVVKNGAGASARAMRATLHGLLPGHMVPSAFIELEALPITPHGKVDRAQLQRFEPAPGAGDAPDPPQSETERRLADLWAGALALGSVGRSDDFFALGGDSLTAAVVAANVHQAFGVQLNLAAFVDHATLAELARVIDGLHAGAPAHAVDPPIVRASRDRPLPLSFFQERIWKFSQSASGAAGYTVPNRDVIEGPLDPAILAACLEDLFSRHEILRTTFPVIDGRPVQAVAPPSPVPLPLCDLSASPDAESALWAAYQTERARPFDLARGPLMRLSLVRLRADLHWLISVNHHIISDGWSRQIMFRELAQFYEIRSAGGVPPPPAATLQYGDFAAWQRANYEPRSARYIARIAWWRDTLSPPPPPIEPPALRPRPQPGADPDQGVLFVRIDPDTVRRLAALCRAAATTDFVVRLAGFAACLSIETRRPDFAIGTYVTNRTRSELQEMLGCFVNLIVLRIACDPDRSFRAFLSETRRVLTSAEMRADIPHEQLRDELASRGVAVPGLTVLFSDSSRRERLHFAGLTLTRRRHDAPATMPWGFSVVSAEQDGEHLLRADFDAVRYDPVAVRSFIERVVRFCDAASRDPDRSLAALGAEAAG
ncbi:MAG: AMP-binding protein [Alphaproteobacteria bacterium]|nr:AMP-binding protein [Alphaproteobacteria bacterium]